MGFRKATVSTTASAATAGRLDVWPVVYTLTEKDLEAVQGRGYRPGDIRVTPHGLTITLVPEAAR